MQIGLFGLGRMGANMARRWHRDGHDVVVAHPSDRVALIAQSAAGPRRVHHRSEQDLERDQSATEAILSGEIDHAHAAAPQFTEEREALHLGQLAKPTIGVDTNGHLLGEANHVIDVLPQVRSVAHELIDDRRISLLKRLHRLVKDTIEERLIGVDID